MTGLTGTDSWFWLDPAPRTEELTVTLAGETVTVRAEPSRGRVALRRRDRSRRRLGAAVPGRAAAGGRRPSPLRDALPSRRSGPEPLRAWKLRLERVRGRGGCRLADHVLGERSGRRERHAAVADDRDLDRLSGERGAWLPRSGSVAVTGFLLGLVFAAGVALVWAGAVCGVELRAGSGRLSEFGASERAAAESASLRARGARLVGSGGDVRVVAR